MIKMAFKTSAIAAERLASCLTSDVPAIGITTAIKGLEMPLTAGNYGDVNIEGSVDIILKIMCYGIMKR